MEEQLISFETAKLAKEKGFDALCYDAFNSIGNLYSNGWCEYLYDNKVEIPFRSGVLESQDILAPTQSLLAKWLREKHEIYVTPRESYAFDQTLEFVCSVNNIFVNHGNNDEPVNRFKTYEESYEIGLQEALKLIK